jgi:hypothetical protein
LSPNTDARRFAAQADAAIADLEQRLPAGTGRMEFAVRLRGGVARGVKCADRLARDGVVVAGSARRARVRQLVKTEQGAAPRGWRGVEKLAWRAEHGGRRR